MAVNRGKKFEAKVKDDWKKCFPKSFIYRLPDQISGYLTTSQNPCDFIGFTNKMLFLMECKSTNQNTLNFAKIRQYERLVSYIGTEDTYPGVLVWFEKQDKVMWFPAEELQKIREAGHKSINANMVDEYMVVDIPSVKRRVFLNTDYTYLVKALKEMQNG